MNKKEVQKRVLQNGKPLAFNKFNWDGETKTFSSVETDLVIDFNGLSNCTFNTGSYCTFNTGSYCTFDTGSSCTFKTGFSCTFNTSFRCIFKTGSYCTFDIGPDCTLNTGDNCTFNTGPDCTFDTGSNCTFDTCSSCTFDTGKNGVIVRRDIFEVIQKKEIKLCPYNIAGHLELINDKWYLNGDKKLGEHIIQDNILSKVISKRGNVYRVINHNSKVKTYLITNGHDWSHGKTLKEAKDSLVYKISNRDKSDYNDMKLSTIYTYEEAIKMYRVITGACESGVREFIQTQGKIKEKYSVKEIIKITEGQYGNDTLTQFLRKN